MYDRIGKFHRSHEMKEWRNDGRIRPAHRLCRSTAQGAGLSIECSRSYNGSAVPVITFFSLNSLRVMFCHQLEQTFNMTIYFPVE